MKRFNIIAAMSNTNRGIGFDGDLPWKYTEDMNFFRKTTTMMNGPDPNTVIMGRKTWESIPRKYKPLPDRQNIVVSRSIPPGLYKFTNKLDKTFLPDTPYNIRYGGEHSFVEFHNSLESALLANTHNDNNTFVIGGSQLYDDAIKLPECDKIYLTHINEEKKEYKFDTFFPKLPRRFKLIDSQNGKNKDLTFNVYQNWSDINSQEHQYLNLMRDILNKGQDRKDRTGIGTRSLFGKQLTFSLRNGVIPLLTTKKVFWKGVVEELLFFLRGDHDNRKLQAKGVHIWDGNTSREYLDNYNKQHINTGDLGLAYGVQWRSAGTDLGNIDTDYKGKGIDQLKEVVDAIRNNPHSRRIIINGWNVPQLNDMALPPCHMLYQFYVDNGELSCMMTQR